MPEITKNEIKKFSFKRLTPRSTFITLVIFLILLVLGKTIYTKVFYKPEIVEYAEIVASPSETVQNFYSWYMDYRGNSVETGAYKSNSDLSAVFINNIDNRLYKNQLDYDPFVCDVDKPFGVSVLSETLANGRTSATVLINEDYGEDKTVEVRLVLEGVDWKISGIDCSQIEDTRKMEEEKSKNKVTVYLLNSGKNTDDVEGCGAVYVVERVVSDLRDPLSVALGELFRGITKAEEVLGYSSIFSESTSGILKEVRITNETVYVELQNYDEFINGLTPCEVKGFKSQVKKTVAHYKQGAVVIE